MKLRYAVDNWRTLASAAVGLALLGTAAFGYAGLLGDRPSAPTTYLDHQIVAHRLPFDIQACRPEVVGENVLAVCGRPESPHWAVILVRQDGTVMVREIVTDGVAP